MCAGGVPYLLGDSKVDEVGGNAHFRQIVGVGQLGGHVQLEVGIVVNIRAPQPDEAAVALAGDCALQQWQQLRLQAATHFFHLGSAEAVSTLRCVNSVMRQCYEEYPLNQHRLWPA